MRKKLLILLLLSFNILNSQSQELYEDNESPSKLNFMWSTGSYTRAVANPAQDAINSSSSVSRQIRSSNAYDMILYNAKVPALDVGPYLSGAKRFTMQFYSAHPGTLIQLTFANAQKAAVDWPVGRHSDYTATTTKTNEWETLTFNLSYQPDPSVSNEEIDQFIFIFDPTKSSSSGNTYYFDSLVGPTLMTPELSTVLYDNAEGTLLLEYPSANGTLNTSIDNPNTGGENTSLKTLRYDRGTAQYSAINLQPTETILSMAPYVGNRKKMTMQFYSAHPGTEVVLIFSNSEMTGTWPAGFHSTFNAFTTLTNAWETLEFNFGYRPDPTVPHLGIDGITLQIAPNTFQNRTYYFDNFYGPDILVPGTPQLHINEIMASNSLTIKDETGEAEDWIEIYNSGDGGANLNGYYLSDNSTTPQKWVFPDMFINPGEYALIWASGKNTVSQNGAIHTNFKISSDGENLLFLNPLNDTVDYVPAIGLNTDISYGRQPDGNGDWTYFSQATPKKTNSTAPFEGLLSSTPTFSLPGGFYETEFNLGIGNSEPGTELRYTLDGSEPTINSPLYSDSIYISNRSSEPNKLANIVTTYVEYVTFQAPDDLIFKGTTVRARLFKEGFLPGPVMTNSYFVDPDMLQRYNVPVWSVVTDSINLFGHEEGIYVPGKVFEDWRNNNPDIYANGGVPANYNQRGMDWERSASVEFFEPAGAGNFKLDAGLRVHGGWSRGNPQKSLRFHFRNQYNEQTLTYPVFPNLKQKANGRDAVDQFRRITLRTSGNDNGSTMFRDALMHSLISHTSVDNMAYRPSVAFLNGEFWGIFNIRERIDKHYFENHYNVDPNDVAILSFNGNVEAGIQQDADDYSNMRNYIDNNDISDSIVYHTVQSQIDINNFIDYQLSEIYYNNRDWPGNNCLYWKIRNGDPTASAPGQDGKWRWVLIDTDFGFNGAPDAPLNTLEFATDSNNSVWPNPAWSTFLLRKLLDNDSFKNEFINRFADQMNSSFKTERVLNKITDMKSVLNPIMGEQIQRWGQPYSLTAWEDNVQGLRDFATLRPAYQRQHILDYFNLSGTQEVTIDVNNNIGGEVKISSLRLNNEVPGVDPDVYPWKGIYFEDVPVKVIAIADAGYKFIGWNGHISTSADTTIFIEQAVNLTAYFSPIEANDEYPSAHILVQRAYTFNEWSNVSEAGTYPPSMVFMQSEVIDPGLSADMNNRYIFKYNLDSRTRIEGINSNGIAFINTGTTNDLLPLTQGRDLGAAILALNTSGVHAANISFTAGTVLPNSRIYAIRLQYRVGNSGTFTDINHDGTPVEYMRNETESHTTRFENIEFPADALDKPYVQLRWVYHFISGLSGPRAKLNIDDILIEKRFPTGLHHETNDHHVSVFPNPSTGSINFRMANNYIGPVNILIFDYSGKTLLQADFNKEEKELIRAYEHVFNSSGLYFIKWQAGEKHGVEKVMID